MKLSKKIVAMKLLPVKTSTGNFRKPPGFVSRGAYSRRAYLKVCNFPQRLTKNGIIYLTIFFTIITKISFLSAFMSPLKGSNTV